MCHCVLDFCYYAIFLFFFFQAEDGIRDLVRSRGLGDVYKRQRLGGVLIFLIIILVTFAVYPEVFSRKYFLLGAIAVSYTHLTLPTSDLV